MWLRIHHFFIRSNDVNCTFWSVSGRENAMKVLLIYPNARSELIGWGDLGAIAEPLALEYLAAGAISDGHEVRILNLRLHRQELDVTLESFQPDIVGVTGYSMHVL